MRELAFAEGLLDAMVRSSQRRVQQAEEACSTAVARAARLEQALRGLLDADERESRGDSFAWREAHKRALEALEDR
jgi:hypothetical protein